MTSRSGVGSSLLPSAFGNQHYAFHHPLLPPRRVAEVTGVEGMRSICLPPTLPQEVCDALKPRHHAPTAEHEHDVE